MQCPSSPICLQTACNQNFDNAVSSEFDYFKISDTYTSLEPRVSQMTFDVVNEGVS